MKEVILNRLREQLIEVKRCAIKSADAYRRTRYNAMREFCLDCSLLSFAEIEQMEYEILNS